MRTGEKWIFILMGASAAALGVWKFFVVDQPALVAEQPIPFYSTASKELNDAAATLYRRYHCRQCHVLWGVRDVTQSVPAPALDGIGALRDEDWLSRYLAAEDPQAILPSRLKPEYRMPSYAHLPQDERETLAAHLASLKVQPWYLDEVKHQECQKLTGGPCGEP